MQTPWEQIPLDDYEGHMALPTVGQSAVLADQFERLIERHRPCSVAIIGCAGGNGLDRIDSTAIERVVAVDINSKYIAATRERYAARLPGICFVCADIQSDTLEFEAVDLMYAALIFEYVDLAATLATLRRNLKKDGVFAVLLQLPHASQRAITPSPYRSLNKLDSVLTLVEPDKLRETAQSTGFRVGVSQPIAVPSGKQFLLQEFHCRSDE